MLSSTQQDTLLAAYSRSLVGEEPNSLKGMESKSGLVTLNVNSGQAQKVVLKLYIATPNAFAVVFPDKLMCLKHCGLIQLKNFTVEPEGECDFVLMLKHAEGGKSLLFSASSPCDRDSWISSFQNISRNSQSCKLKRKSNKSRGLPSLEEVSEEKEQQEEAEQIRDSHGAAKNGAERQSGERRRKRRVVETPSLEQISEEEEEEDEFQNFTSFNSTRRRSSISDTVLIDSTKSKDSKRRSGSSFRSL